MKKYTFKLAISALVLVSSLLSGPSMAFAADTDSGIVGLVEPRYAALRSFLATLSISEGQASCSVSVRTYNSYTTEVTMELQDENSGWQTIKSWTSSGGTSVSSSKKYYVSRNNTYRVVGTVSIYDNRGNLVETAEAYSDEISY